MYLVCSNKFDGGGGELAARNMCAILTKHGPTYLWNWLEFTLLEYKIDRFQKIPRYKIIKIFCNAKIIYSHLYISNILILLCSHLIMKKNIILFNHGSPNNIKFLPKLQKFMIRILYSHAERIYCITNEVKNDLIELGLRHENVYQINNPIMIQLEYKSHTKTDVYIFVGRIEKIKNIGTIIRAVHEVGEELNIYGQGRLTKFYEATFPHTWPRIYRGFRNNIVREIAISKALILMSEREGIPMVALEAIYTHTPLIISGNLNSIKFLLGSALIYRDKFNVHQNGIMLNGSSQVDLMEALKFLKGKQLKVTNLSVLNYFTVENFEEQLPK